MRINYGIILVLIVVVLASHVFLQGMVSATVSLIALFAIGMFILSGIYA